MAEVVETDEEVSAKLNVPLAAVKECREMFNLIDLDGGGSLDAEEMMKLMDLMGMMALESEVQELIEKIDQTGEGEVVFSDFVRVTTQSVDTDYTAKDVCEAFDFFSKSKRRKAGHVTGADLREILTQYGEDTFTKEDAEERISSIPGVNSGTLDREVDIRSFVESTMF
eukprot:g6409.t1